MANTPRSRTLRYLVTGALLISPVACNDAMPPPETAQPTLNETREEAEGAIAPPATDETETANEDGTDEPSATEGGLLGQDIEINTNEAPPRMVVESMMGTGRHRPTPNLAPMYEAPIEETE